MNKLKLECPHSPKNFRLTFTCNSTGDYVIELCKKCYDKESKEHLISEETLQ